INRAIREVLGEGFRLVEHIREVFARVFPSISLKQREEFHAELLKSAALDETALAGQARLYLDTRQLNSLAAGDFEVGNHTYSHVHCRNLSLKEIEREIGGNKTALEAASGRTIRSFSQPYGSSRDVTPQLAQYLQSTGHHSAFLSESVANFRGSDR